jgi:hypothetical protein
VAETSSISVECSKLQTPGDTTSDRDADASVEAILASPVYAATAARERCCGTLPQRVAGE